MPNLLLAGLLLANFPVAGLYIVIGERLVLAGYQCHVQIVNQSPMTITSFVVTDPSGQTVELGPVEPGQVVRHRLYPDGEGSVTFTATTDEGMVSDILEGYVTWALNDFDTTVVFHSDGSHTVTRNPAPAGQRRR